MFPEVGPLEILVVLIIALVVFGPKRLPELGSSLGKGIRGFTKGIKGEEDEEPAEPAAVTQATAAQATAAEPEKQPGTSTGSKA